MRGSALRSVAALVVAVVVVPAAPAGAGAPWVSPVVLAPEGGTRAQVTMNPAGQGLAVWSDPSFNGVFVADMPPLGAFGAPRKLAEGAHTGPVAELGANGDAIVAWGDYADQALRVAIRPAGADFGAPAVLTDPGQGLMPSRSYAAGLAIAPDGTALIAWLETERDVNFYSSPEHYVRVRAAWRPAGGAFGPAQTVSHFYSGASDIRATIDDSGRATIAWVSGEPDARAAEPTEPQVGCPSGCAQAPARVWSAVGTATAGFGAPVDPSGPVGWMRRSSEVVALAGNAGGEVVAAWLQDDRGGPSGVFGATRAADGTWSRPIGLYTSDPVSVTAFSPDAAIDARGNAVVAWEATCEGMGFRYRPAGSGFGPMIGGCGGGYGRGVPAVGIDSHGRAVVAWAKDRGDHARGPVRTSRYLPGSEPEPIFDVSGKPGGRNIAAAVAFDQLGNGVLLWEGDSGDQARSGYDGTRPIQMALYDATPPKLARVTVMANARRPALRYRLSEPARVSATVERRVACTKRGHTRCFARVASLSRRGVAGDNKLRLSSRLRRALRRRGSYRARLVALDRAGNRARQRSISFRELRR